MNIHLLVLSQFLILLKPLSASDPAILNKIEEHCQEFPAFSKTWIESMMKSSKICQVDDKNRKICQTKTDSSLITMMFRKWEKCIKFYGEWYDQQQHERKQGLDTLAFDACKNDNFLKFGAQKATSSTGSQTFYKNVRIFSIKNFKLSLNVNSEYLDSRCKELFGPYSELGIVDGSKDLPRNLCFAKNGHAGCYVKRRNSRHVRGESYELDTFPKQSDKNQRPHQGIMEAVCQINCCVDSLVYKFFPDFNKENKNEKTFGESIEYCQSRNMKMATIQSAEEESKFRDEMETQTNATAGQRKQNYWLGGRVLSDDSNANFRTCPNSKGFYWLNSEGKIDGTKPFSQLYQNWPNGEPSNSGSNKCCLEYCTYIDNSGRCRDLDSWNDRKCHYKSGVVCEQRNVCS